MTSIYETPPAWTNNTSYSKFDIVRQSGRVYYSKFNHTVGVGESFNVNLWDGVGVDNGITKTVFFFKPTWNSPITVEPRVRIVQLGDGYQQRFEDGINSTLVKIELGFDGKTDKEALAINYFLYSRRGVESFLYTPFEPFNAQKRFICQSWTDVPVFKTNNSIRAVFQEVVN